jgi:hypothetical protein
MAMISSSEEKFLCLTAFLDTPMSIFLVCINSNHEKLTSVHSMTVV